MSGAEEAAAGGGGSGGGSSGAGSSGGGSGGGAARRRFDDKGLVARTSLILWHTHQNDVGAVRKLLEEDAALVNARDYDSRTPLHVAALHGWHDVAECLIANGADVNAQDRWQNTVILLSCCLPAFSLSRSLSQRFFFGGGSRFASSSGVVPMLRPRFGSCAAIGLCSLRVGMVRIFGYGFEILVAYVRCSDTNLLTSHELTIWEEHDFRQPPVFAQEHFIRLGGGTLVIFFVGFGKSVLLTIRTLLHFTVL